MLDETLRLSLLPLLLQTRPTSPPYDIFQKLFDPKNYLTRKI